MNEEIIIPYESIDFKLKINKDSKKWTTIYFYHYKKAFFRSYNKELKESEAEKEINDKWGVYKSHNHSMFNFFDQAKEKEIIIKQKTYEDKFLIELLRKAYNAEIQEHFKDKNFNDAYKFAYSKGYFKASRKLDLIFNYLKNIEMNEGLSNELNGILKILLMGAKNEN